MTRAWKCLPIAAVAFLWTNAASAEQVQTNPIVIHEVKHDVSAPLREMAAKAKPPAPGIVEMREHRSPKHIFQVTPGIDPVTQDESSYLPAVSYSKLLSFDGVNGNQGGAIPPDTNGSVGSTQYVLITNFDYAVYDKTTGTQILAPTRIHNIWSGFGGQCGTEDGGDPIVLWDKMAQRWLVEQLEYFTSDQVCVAVSTTSDATGTYNRYAFNFNGVLPDYPKIGVWPDAYYLSVNAFGAGYAEPCAMDRTAMLSGGTAAMICFPSNSLNFGFLPADFDGTTAPPAGAPNHFMELGNTTSSINYWDFHVDFTNPQNSTFTGPNVIKVPTYVVTCGGGGGACIPQPSPGSLVDAIGARAMFRHAYRNFGDHEALVFNHPVKPGNGATSVGATRWYEFRATPVGGTFSLYQAGTFQSKTNNVWMGSMAMDKVGDIAVGASEDSKTLFPSIIIAGRTSADALGKLEAPLLVAKGKGVQTGTNRWGDYSSMSVDPTDDCTFWYAQEYYTANGENWITHVTSFKFTGCQ